MSNQKNVLTVKAREDRGTNAARRARHAGLIPAVIYGRDRQNQHLLVQPKEWKTLLSHEVHLVELKNEQGTSTMALIKDHQFDYLNGRTLHIDFLEVKMDQKIKAHVKLHSKGTPIGLSQGGLLEQNMHEVTISCTPSNLPDAITIDISAIPVGGSIHIRDLVLPAGVSIDGDQNLVVFSVIVPKEEKAAGNAAEAEAKA